MSTTLLCDYKSGISGEQRLEWSRFGVSVRSSGAAEKGGEGMALKICTGAKAFLKANINTFDITEIRMLAIKEKIAGDEAMCYYDKFLTTGTKQSKGE